MNTNKSPKPNCVTHHHACACREEQYANLRHQYDLRLAELEQAKADRNKAAMMERRKYLPKLRELQAEVSRLRSVPPNDPGSPTPEPR